MANAHQLQIGDIQCAVLHEGSSPLAVDGLAGRYPGATQEEIVEALGGKTESETSLNCLFIDNGEVKILADVGFGENGPGHLGNLVPALESIGVKPEAIDVIYITHFHGDHIAGLINKDKQPAYPNARYITMQAEWDEWIPKWKVSHEDAHERSLTMMESLEGKFTFVQDGDEIATGVRVVGLPGHTLGQSGLLVESNDEQLIHLADVLHQPFQFQYTDWHFAFDSDGAIAVNTRKDILQRCADEQLLTLFYHLSFPGLGHIQKAGDTFLWQAI